MTTADHDHPQFHRLNDAVHAALAKVSREFEISPFEIERQRVRVDQGLDLLIGAMLAAMDGSKTRAAYLKAAAE